MAAPGPAKGNSRVAEKPKTHNKQWAELFKTISKPSSTFKLQKWKEEDRQIEQSELRNLGICLVGFMLGRFTGWQGIETVRKAWGVDCSCTLHETGWMIFRFKSEEDRDLVLERGPYESMGVPWILKKLPPYFSFKDECFNTVPTWIRLNGLPLDLWTENALGKIASFIGEPLAADEGTVRMTKTSFARLLVEVEVSKPLVREVKFKLPDGSLFTQVVAYEREPKWCPSCRMMSHNEVDCRRKKEGAATKLHTAPKPQGSLQLHTEDAATGGAHAMQVLQEQGMDDQNLNTKDQSTTVVAASRLNVVSQLEHEAQADATLHKADELIATTEHTSTPVASRVKGKELEVLPMNEVL